MTPRRGHDAIRVGWIGVVPAAQTCPGLLLPLATGPLQDRVSLGSGKIHDILRGSDPTPKRLWVLRLPGSCGDVISCGWSTT